MLKNHCLKLKDYHWGQKLISILIWSRMSINKVSPLLSLSLIVLHIWLDLLRQSLVLSQLGLSVAYTHTHTHTHTHRDEYKHTSSCGGLREEPTITRRETQALHVFIFTCLASHMAATFPLTLSQSGRLLINLTSVSYLRILGLGFSSSSFSPISLHLQRWSPGALHGCSPHLAPHTPDKQTQFTALHTPPHTARNQN